MAIPHALILAKQPIHHKKSWKPYDFQLFVLYTHRPTLQLPQP